MASVLQEYGKVVDLSNPPETWEEDGFKSWEDSEEYWTKQVGSWFKQSVEAFYKKKQEWDKAERLLALEHVLQDASEHPSRSRLPHLKKIIEEYIATRTQETLRPQGSSRQPSMDNCVGALNYFKDVELDEGEYETLMVLKAVQQLRCAISFMRVDVDPDRQGPFGHYGKHTVSLVDPRCVWPDPYAESWRWEDMKYLIIAKPMDLTDIQKQWPAQGHRVKPDDGLSYDESAKHLGKTETNKVVDDLLKGPTGAEVGRRQRALVLECYLKDERTRMVDGNAGTEYQPNIKHVDRYPNGRVLIVCGDVLLRDSGNPYDHGEPPIVAFPEHPYEGLFATPPVNLLNIAERKADLLLREGYQNLRVHSNNQWLVDRNAFTKPEQFNNISQDPRQVFIVRPGSRVQRLPPGNMPPEYFQFVDMLFGFMDDVLGITDINRGGLQKGAQLAADAISQLQGAGMQRIKMKMTLDKDGVVRVGKLMLSNIRQFYPSELSVQVKDPAGEEVQFVWKKAEFKNNWALKIEAGSNAPGSKLSALQQALQLYDRGVVDEEFVLGTAGVAGAPEILKRIQARKEKLVELGFIKEGLQIGKPRRGAKVKEPQV